MGRGPFCLTSRQPSRSLPPPPRLTPSQRRRLCLIRLTPSQRRRLCRSLPPSPSSFNAQPTAPAVPLPTSLPPSSFNAQPEAPAVPNLFNAQPTAPAVPGKRWWKSRRLWLGVKQDHRSDRSTTIPAIFGIDRQEAGRKVALLRQTSISRKLFYTNDLRRWIWRCSSFLFDLSSPDF